MAARVTLVELLLDLAWSQWTALGVAGSGRVAEVPVDLEALLLLTAELAEEDPRLRDEALDWCSRFHGFASKPRLKQLLRRSPPSVQSAFGPFAHALEQHAGTPWPGSSGAGSVPTGLSGAAARHHSGLVLDPARDERFSRPADPNADQVGSPRRRRSGTLPSPALRRPPGAGSGASGAPRHDSRCPLGLGALYERATRSRWQ